MKIITGSSTRRTNVYAFHSGRSLVKSVSRNHSKLDDASYALRSASLVLNRRIGISNLTRYRNGVTVLSRIYRSFDERGRLSYEELAGGLSQMNFDGIDIGTLSALRKSLYEYSKSVR